jgi:hypothetical protein
MSVTLRTILVLKALQMCGKQEVEQKRDNDVGFHNNTVSGNEYKI